MNFPPKFLDSIAEGAGAGHGDNRGTSSIGISALNQFQFMFFLFMMFNFIFVFLNPTKFDHAGIGMETYNIPLHSCHIRIIPDI